MAQHGERLKNFFYVTNCDQTRTLENVAVDENVENLRDFVFL